MWERQSERCKGRNKTQKQRLTNDTQGERHSMWDRKRERCKGRKTLKVGQTNEIDSNKKDTQSGTDK